MLVDLFWKIATSDLVLTVVGVIALAAIVVSHVPLIRWIPTIDHWMKLASAVGYVALSLFFLFVGFRLSDERAETARLKTELDWSRNQLEQQEAQAQDAERLKGEAEARAAAIKGELDDYRKTYAGRPDGVCAFTADDIERLRSLTRRPR